MMPSRSRMHLRTQTDGFALSLTFIILSSVPAASQVLQIGIIDFYGLHRVAESDARRALTFTEGDTISLASDEPPEFLVDSEHRLASLPGVVCARTNVVCCNQGRIIIYVGIEEEGQDVMRFRTTPGGAARL